MPKAGLEPARLAAPPPQDGVSANSTTSARFNSAFVSGAETVYENSLFLFRCGRCRRRALLLLPLRGLLLLLLLIALSGTFTDNRRAAWPRNQDREREGRNHKDDRCGCCGLA